MALSNLPQPLSSPLRMTLAVTALMLLALTFKVMTALSTPSQFLNAYKAASGKPGQAVDLQKLSLFNPNLYLYLVGPVLPASGSKEPDFLFNETGGGLVTPAVYNDASGAVEVLSPRFPITLNAPRTYMTNQTLHMLGRRVSNTGLELFMLADSQQDLLTLLKQHSEDWQSTFFWQGLFLAFLVFSIFWLLNITILSNPALQRVQFLIVNVVFLILFYSVLMLSDYPILSTLLHTLAILGLANAVFAGLSWAVQQIQKKRARVS